MGSRPDPPLSGVEPLRPAAEPARAFAHRWDYSLARALLRLQSERWTGNVRVEAEGVITRIHLRAGQPVFVGGGLPADSLGRMLVQRGWLTEAQLAQVVEHRMSIQGRQPFGQVACALGVLDEAALSAALDDQVRDKLMRCLHWEYGELTLEEVDHGHAARPGGPSSIEPLLLSALHRYFNPARVQDVLAPGWSHPVRLVSARERVAQRFQLDAQAVAVLDGSLEAPSLGDFLDSPDGQAAGAGQLLCALALSDQLEMPALQGAATEAPARPGSEEQAADDEREPATRADNDQYSRRAPEPGRTSRLRLVRKSAPIPVVSAADPVLDAGIPSRDKLLADSAFLQGRELLRVDEFAAAADAFKTASALRPGAREYGLHAAWAGYLAGGRSARWRARLEAQCRGALAQDRHLAFGHHVLGQLALEDDQLDVAREAFSRALELDPNDDLAREALQRLQK